ncbi:TE2IP protein, partial [Chroicocephalus maculipennis]|nr:TE2IP protein [Chroicocephalus maculipennis]
AGRSRSLFLWDDGSPMRFYVRPGLAKLRLAPLVLAGGGRLCRVQEPGAVLLAQRGEAAPAGAVSTEYVTECRAESGGLFEAANREFESTEVSMLQALLHAGSGRCWLSQNGATITRRFKWLCSVASLQLWLVGSFSGSDTSDISEELATRDGEGKAPGETASGLKTRPEDSVLPDTQLQSEERPTRTCSSSSLVGEVVKTMQHFMEKFGMDLFTVTQAFLKNTGEVETTLYFLQTGQRLDGYPLWSREDDLELQKDDERVRNRLIAKFGAENVAKRVAFRKS